MTDNTSNSSEKLNTGAPSVPARMKLSQTPAKFKADKKTNLLSQNLEASELSHPFIKRAPKIARSAIFGVLFMTAIFVTILAVIFSFSNEGRRIARALLALELNLFLIGFLALFLGIRVWTTLFAKVSRRTAPLLHRRFVFIFSLAALLPAVIVGAFSLYFNATQ